jgi:threonine dehydratase
MVSLLIPKLDSILQASDDLIAASVLKLMEKAKIVVEGASALTLAVLPQIRDRIKGKKVVLIIGGGNIDLNLLSRIIDIGMIRSGRRIRLNVTISDRPGSLLRLTQLIAEKGANVLQTIHDRNAPSTSIDKTDVELTLETRGLEHAEEVIGALKQQVYKLALAH